MRVREFVALGVLAMILPVHAAAASDVVTVEAGKLHGVSRDSVVAFKGIPYAAPPTGNLRWRAPQSVEHWKGVRSAEKYGHDCMQLPFPGDAAPLATTPAEDCLDLNVWMPAAKSNVKLPVMVWIYGGGFVNGGSSPAVYDGTQFARQGVVFVSFNYRLGRFGFFAHPSLIEEARSAPAGNYAFMDQIAALKWVKDNIAAFGGDAGKVTLFGESAGGGSVLSLMTSPLAEGLFQQAIIESGGGREGLGGMALMNAPTANGKPSAATTAMAFAQAKGITGTDSEALAELRKLSAEQVLDGLNMASMFQSADTYSGPMIDGNLIVETPQDAFMAGHQMKIPVIVGANSYDLGFSVARNMKEIMEPFGRDKDRAMKIYDPNNSDNVSLIGTTVAADRMMLEPARFVAREVAAAEQPAYAYRFSYVAVAMRKEWEGAPHASEIPFVFDTVQARYGKALDPADIAMAKAMNTYWVAFAKNADPNISGLPRWPAYAATSDELMEFTSAGPVAKADPWKTRLDLIEGVAVRPPKQ